MSGGIELPQRNEEPRGSEGIGLDMFLKNLGASVQGEGGNRGIPCKSFCALTYIFK